jgi:hypothetical protein
MSPASYRTAPPRGTSSNAITAGVTALARPFDEFR